MHNSVEEQSQWGYEKMPLLALNLFARIVAMRVNARPPYMGTSMSRAKSAGKHHLSFGRYWRCDERKAWYILAALRNP